MFAAVGSCNISALAVGRVPPVGGAEKVTVGADVNPVPPLVRVIESTNPSVAVVIAAPADPPPPVIVTVGLDVYPDPPFVTSIPTITPPLT